MKLGRLQLVAVAVASGLLLMLPAVSTPARSRVATPVRSLAPTPGLPGKLSLCEHACGPETAHYSRLIAEPLSNMPAALGAPSLFAAATPEGPFPNADDPRAFSPAQRVLAGLPMLTVYAGVATWAYFAWYHKQPQRPRMKVNDSAKEGFSGNTYGGGADKLGHFWATYFFARVGAKVLIDRGWSPLAAVLMNVTFTLTLYTLIEVKDGFHPGYGFSREDQVANVLGCAVAALLLLVPTLDALFSVRMYYRPSKLFLNAVMHEGDIDISEDYTGETVMLVFHLGGLSAVRKSPHFRFLRYLDLMVGYNARGFLPQPSPSVLREQELFFGVSLNLVEIFRDIYPNGQRFGWAAQILADINEFVQLTPVHKTVGKVWQTPQPKRKGHWVVP